MSDTVWVIGVSMTRFGRFPDHDIVDLAASAAGAALADAGIGIADVDAMAAGSRYEAGTMLGQRIQRQIGETGVPVFNVANACATGAAAVRAVHLAIKAGEARVGLAVGAEQMGKRGMLVPDSDSPDRRERFTPSGRDGALFSTEGILGTQLMPGVFAHVGMRYAKQHGVTLEQFAQVAVKNHHNSTLNPLAQYQEAFTLEQVMSAPMVGYPNTVLMSCPTSDGAAAAVLASDEFVEGLPVEQRRRAVKISAATMTSSEWSPSSSASADVSGLTRRAADQAYEQAGIGPDDLDLVEMHDCFASAELVHYDNLRLCEPGGAGDFVDSAAGWRGGRTPVNVSGGLLSKGHPLGATGIANIYEVATQLRGEAGARQLERHRVGLTHVIGIGSACVVHVLERRAQ